MVADNLATPAQVAAWQMIQDGIAGVPAVKRQKIWDGTVEYTRQEQHVTAQRIYDEVPNREMFAFLTNENWFKTQLKSPVPGDTGTFGSVVQAGVNGGPANVAVAEDRWQWISAANVGVLAKWRQWSDANNNIPLTQVTYDAIDIKGLQDDLPLMNDIVDMLKWRPTSP
jgi:hypothetical protein